MTGFVLGFSVTSAAQVQPAKAPLTAEQVVEKMVERNEQRARALSSYSGRRVYQLDYNGWSSKSATLVVSMTYQRPDQKEFCIVSESGSDFLQNRVLKRLLDAEVEAMQEAHRRQVALHPENYTFQLVGSERMHDREFFVLDITPRVKSKFLFRGRIWVDGRDFAVARMSGEPAKNPSWWTKRNNINVTYQKVGDFWLPARNETTTQIRFRGRSLLTIVYRDYEILTDAVHMTALPAATAQRCAGEPK